MCISVLIYSVMHLAIIETTGLINESTNKHHNCKNLISCHSYEGEENEVMWVNSCLTSKETQ